MRLSKRSEYGLKAAVRLGRRYGSGYVQARDIAMAEMLPAKFLESILLALRAGGMLESKVGSGGGYRLARPPEQINVWEVVEALEPPDATVNSLPPNGHHAMADGSATAGRHAMSVLHERIEEAFDEAVGSLTLAELVALAEARGQDHDHIMYYI